MLNGMDYNGTIFFVIYVFFHVSSSYGNKLASCTYGTFEDFFFPFLSLVQIKRIDHMFYIASYHYYLLEKKKIISKWHVIDL
jgi:hypothetical protein